MKDRKNIPDPRRLRQKGNGDFQEQRLAVADISIRSGLGTEDEVVGVLPRGMGVPEVEKRSEWVKIGKNR